MLPIFYARKKIDSNNKEAILVDKISQVYEPAIEQNFIAMEKLKTKKVFLNEEKTCLVGPVLIPELDILRYDDKIGYYQLRYDKEVIQDCMNKFVAGGLTGESNIEHSDNSKIEGVYADNWIITETNQYKAKALGFGELPIGTWMTAFFPTDKTVLTEDLLSKIKGFSIEGWFYHEEVKNEINNNDMLSKLNDAIKEIQSFLGMQKKSKLSFLESIKVIQKVMTVAETSQAIFMNDETMVCNWINADGTLGELVPVGTYVLESGETLVVAEGSIGSITSEENLAIAEAEVTMSAAKVELEKLVLDNQTLRAELEALKKTTQTVVLPTPNPIDKGETKKVQMSEVEFINSRK